MGTKSWRDFGGGGMEREEMQGLKLGKSYSYRWVITLATQAEIEMLFLQFAFSPTLTMEGTQDRKASVWEWGRDTSSVYVNTKG